MHAPREELKSVLLVLVSVATMIGWYFFPSVITGLIACLLFVLALLCALDDRLLARSGRRAQGTVVGHRAEENCFFPIVEFRDSKGTIRRETTRMGNGARQPSVGAELVVVYDVTGIRGCEIDTFWRRRGFAVLLVLLSVIFMLGTLWGK